MTTALVRRADWERWQRVARQARYLANYAAMYGNVNRAALEIRQVQENIHTLAAAHLDNGESLPPSFLRDIHRISAVALRIEGVRREVQVACNESRAYIRKWWNAF